MSSHVEDEWTSGFASGALVSQFDDADFATMDVLSTCCCWGGLGCILCPILYPIISLIFSRVETRTVVDLVQHKARTTEFYMRYLRSKFPAYDWTTVSPFYWPVHNLAVVVRSMERHGAVWAGAPSPDRQGAVWAGAPSPDHQPGLWIAVCPGPGAIDKVSVTRSWAITVLRAYATGVDGMLWRVATDLGLTVERDDDDCALRARVRDMAWDAMRHDPAAPSPRAFAKAGLPARTTTATIDAHHIVVVDPQGGVNMGTTTDGGDV